MTKTMVSWTNENTTFHVGDISVSLWDTKIVRNKAVVGVAVIHTNGGHVFEMPFATGDGIKGIKQVVKDGLRKDFWVTPKWEEYIQETAAEYEKEEIVHIDMTLYDYQYGLHDLKAIKQNLTCGFKSLVRRTSKKGV